LIMVYFWEVVNVHSSYTSGKRYSCMYLLLLLYGQTIKRDGTLRNICLQVT